MVESLRGPLEPFAISQEKAIKESKVREKKKKLVEENKNENRLMSTLSRGGTSSNFLGHPPDYHPLWKPGALCS